MPAFLAYTERSEGMKLNRLKCQRCGYEWIPRIEDVRICPNKKCHSNRWDTPKEEKKNEKQ